MTTTMFWFLWRASQSLRVCWSLLEDDGKQIVRLRANWGTERLKYEFSASNLRDDGHVFPIPPDEADALRALLALAPDQVLDFLPEQIKEALL